MMPAKTEPAIDPNPADVFRSIIRMWETGDLSQFDRLVSADYVGHVAAGERDREGLRERILAFRQSYPAMHFDVQEQLASGDRVASRMVATGTDAEGRSVALMGLNMSRIKDGKIEEEWNTWEAMQTPPAAQKPLAE